MIDYHLHTARCCHATGSLLDYLAEAERKGIDEVGFADHFPLDLLGFQPRNQVTMDSCELAEYIAEIEELKITASNLTLKLGIEIDYLPGTEEKLEKLLEKYSFDFVIGSIHFMDRWDFTHPDYANDYRNHDLEKLYRQYFNLVWSACKSGLFDIIGHIDVIKKFGYRPEGDLDYLRSETARLLKNTGICFELNTAGRDAPVGEFYPDRRLIEICFAEGVPVTMGSDAHAPEQVGRYYPEAISELKEAGYREVAVFKKRKRNYLLL
ncbi:MAG: histidinol-phosphatase HisJ family protein [Bacillota bacterium]